MPIIHRRSVKKCRKSSICYWCGEEIEVGQPKSQWRWAEDDHCDTIKTHPECKDAWDEAAQNSYEYVYMTGPSEHSRGIAPIGDAQ